MPTRAVPVWPPLSRHARPNPCSRSSAPPVHRPAHGRQRLPAALPPAPESRRQGGVRTRPGSQHTRPTFPGRASGATRRDCEDDVDSQVPVFDGDLACPVPCGLGRVCWHRPRRQPRRLPGRGLSQPFSFSDAGSIEATGGLAVSHPCNQGSGLWKRRPEEITWRGVCGPSNCNSIVAPPPRS